MENTERSDVAKDTGSPSDDEELEMYDMCLDCGNIQPECECRNDTD